MIFRVRSTTDVGFRLRLVSRDLESTCWRNLYISRTTNLRVTPNYRFGGGTVDKPKPKSPIYYLEEVVVLRLEVPLRHRGVFDVAFVFVRITWEKKKTDGLLLEIDTQTTYR